jgi:thioesterase domain-containing protein
MVASFDEAKLNVFFAPFLEREIEKDTKRLAELVWNLSHRNISEFLQGVPEDRKHIVRFEQLVRSPRRTMEAVADFLRLPFHPNMIKPYENEHGDRMTDPIHPQARMLGDVKFIGHGKIRANAASRQRGRACEYSLSEVTRSMARHLGYRVGARRDAILVAIQPCGERIPFFCVHPAGGSVSCYRGLARHLGADQPFYAFQVGADAGRSRRTLQQLAAVYIKELRRVQTRGPYQLGGWSFGGIVAYEMSLQLEEEGEEVAALCLFSAYLPSSRLSRKPIRSDQFIKRVVENYGLSNAADIQDNVLSTERLDIILDTAKRAGVVMPDMQSRDFHDLILRGAETFRAHVRMVRRYCPARKARRLKLFEAEDRRADGDGPFLDWSSGAYHVYREEIPGDHFTMLREPNVAVLAARLRAVLEPVRMEPIESGNEYCRILAGSVRS